MLEADVPAGTWTLVCDGVIIQPVDVVFELIWRHAGGGDVPIATWEQHFDPRGNGNFDAIPCDKSAEFGAMAIEEGDQLVFRYSATGTDTPMAYIPAGDGEVVSGRIPYVDLPQ